MFEHELILNLTRLPMLLIFQGVGEMIHVIKFALCLLVGNLLPLVLLQGCKLVAEITLLALLVLGIRQAINLRRSRFLAHWISF